MLPTGYSHLNFCRLNKTLAEVVLDHLHVQVVCRVVQVVHVHVTVYEQRSTLAVSIVKTSRLADFRGHLDSSLTSVRVAVLHNPFLCF